jgi:hypothetical protein
VRFGRPARPWLLQKLPAKAVVIAGAVVLAMGGVRWALEVDWYQWYPTSVVLAHVRSTNPIVSRSALFELQRRWYLQQLEPGQAAEFAGACLKLRNVPRANDLLGEFLLADQLSEAQRKEFLESIVQPSLTLPGRAVAGVPLSLEFRSTWSGPVLVRRDGKWGEFVVYADAEISVDGEPLRPPEERAHSFWRFLEFKVRNVGSRWAGFENRPLVLATGRHVLSVDLSLEVYYGAELESEIDTDDTGRMRQLVKGGRLLHRSARQITHTVEVLDQRAPGPELLQEPSADAARRAVSVSVRVDQGCNTTVLVVVERWSGPPLALVVESTAGDQWQLVGTLLHQSGTLQSEFNQTCRLDPVPPRVTVRLRPDPTLALAQTQWGGIWGQEIVFQDVPVVNECTPHAPAAASQP